ncbi:hypothetical protein EVAR_81835_1 [Eumeta japonica]|uniref:Uncharacterized protein n=1 Tax=Eumeta variegata TaxID=151549 RepID=A0A4C1XRN1_EUMVA|nr:hypothetical protein EVAR_81835_1 [Eumeta japonica]
MGVLDVSHPHSLVQRESSIDQSNAVTAFETDKCNYYVCFVPNQHIDRKTQPVTSTRVPRVSKLPTDTPPNYVYACIDERMHVIILQ